MVRAQIFYPQPIAVQLPYYTTPQGEAKQQSPEQEIALLENYQIGLQVQKADLEQEMDNIKSRIEELQKTIREKSNK